MIDLLDQDLRWKGAPKKIFKKSVRMIVGQYSLLSPRFLERKYEYDFYSLSLEVLNRKLNEKVRLKLGVVQVS